MNGKILWADDEIELLKPHILFLKDKGYEITQSKSGDEAIEFAQESHFDIVFLDENMPGLSGLETLVRIKAIQPDTPIVMITKLQNKTSEHIDTESIMDMRSTIFFTIILPIIN